MSNKIIRFRRLNSSARHARYYVEARVPVPVEGWLINNNNESLPRIEETSELVRGAMAFRSTKKFKRSPQLHVDQGETRLP
eukprot:scaffold7174_cov55-Attheya_sp.AAC.3